MAAGERPGAPDAGERGARMTTELRIVTVSPETPNHHMIRLGRQSRGMRLGALAQALGIPAREMQRIEQGELAFPVHPVEMRPTSDQFPGATDDPKDTVDLMASILHYPRSFFYQDDGPQNTPGTTFACRSWEDDTWVEWDEEQSEIGKLRRQVKVLQAQVRALKGERA
jgi:hypothetical protein